MEIQSKVKMALIVDDNESIRELLKRILEQTGYKTLTASSGEEAIRLAKNNSPDVALVDISMPGIGGITTLTLLKEIHPQLEVIMLTGETSVETALESMKHGAYDYIAKPFEKNELLHIVKKALEKSGLNRKVDELQEISRLKSEFLANMSHELRTPLNAIIGYTSLILDRVYGEVPEKQEKGLRRVEVNAKNLLQLINNILDISKLNAGRMPVYLEDCGIKDLISEVIDTIGALAAAKKLQIICEIKEDFVAHTDKTKLKQILINLSANAIKFTENGSVKITARVSPENSRMTLEIKDTGIGIAQKDIPLLFEEFKQLDSSSTRKYGGTGLGLSISRKLAELLGGTIHVSSTLGVGSTFTVELPLGLQTTNVQQTAEVLPVTSAATTLGQKVLLAIDDDAEVLTLLKDSLKGTGYAFIGAQSGEEGVALARQLRPFVITLDILMPHRDGWSILQILKNDAELRDIPVMIVSIMENKALGFSLGITDYMVKPFERQALLEKLGELERRLAPNKLASGRLKVLLVDADDATSLKPLKDALSMEGYPIQLATESGEALSCLMGKDKPDVLFVNLMHPDIKGFEILESIEKDLRLKNFPVFAVVSKGLTPQKMEYLERRVEIISGENPLDTAQILGRLRQKILEVEKTKK